jgi:hypothetical protein
LLQNSTANNGFVSLHGAVQHDLTRRLFVSASFLEIWQDGDLNLALFPDQFGNFSAVSDAFFPMTPALTASRFSDFGVGWRFSRNLFVQYVYSTDYGATPGTHALMLRYTFHGGKE